MILLNIAYYVRRCVLMFLGRLSFPWNFRWWWAQSLCIRSAVAHLASAASTAWTWSGFAWPSLSNLNVSKRPALGFILFHQPESDVIHWNICHSPRVLFFNHSSSRIQLCCHRRGSGPEFHISPTWRRPQRRTAALPHGLRAGVQITPTSSVQRGEQMVTFKTIYM